MTGIKLITFDLDDTLWPCRVTMDAAEQALFDWLKIHAPEITQVHDLLSLRDLRMQLRRQRDDIAHDLTALRLLSLQQLMDEFAYPRALAAEGMAHFLMHRNRVTPYAEVAGVLRALRRDYHLISLTNGNADVEQTPLQGLFHHAVRAEDAGAAKPDPAMFRFAMQRGGVRPQEALHLGDDPQLDVMAARALGMRSIWVNRFQRQWPPELPPPQAQISDLNQLKDYL